MKYCHETCFVCYHLILPSELVGVSSHHREPQSGSEVNRHSSNEATAMPHDKEDTGPQAIDASIEKLQNKTSTLKRVQRALFQLDEKAKVSVLDAPDSSMIEVNVRADEPYDELQELANIDNFLMGEAHTPEDIVYDHVNDEYVLFRKYRTNR